MKRFELDLVLAQKVLILPKPIQQLPFGKPSSPGAGLRRRHALNLVPDAVCTGEPAVALDLALLAEDTGEDALGFWPRVALLRHGRRR